MATLTRGNRGENPPYHVSIEVDSPDELKGTLMRLVVKLSDGSTGNGFPETFSLTKREAASIVAAIGGQLERLLETP